MTFSGKTDNWLFVSLINAVAQQQKKEKRKSKNKQKHGKLNL